MEKPTNPFSGELKGKLLKNLSENSNKSNPFEGNLIPKLEKGEDGMYIFSLKDSNDVIFSKAPLATITANVVLVEEKKYLSIYETKVHKDYKRKGIATNMYRYLMENLPENCSGIYSPSETRANDIIIPKIYDILASEYKFTKDDNENYFLVKN